ncbi:LysR substrate-binding domain-containing protein [Trinickia soli]|uniref:LysR family transcriptional regulator n=1 Tax=Trinickia soli TaxID=380675 RepID=A0A2N7VJF6_9BURK|nr:LysR substrate-binding domain-containing protein [Trinickia soli]KAA0079554.1 LysR family transcriptional regulator [Paraburkholderia sp. T12-10]PMS17296.1 LysR family transcriptional regulator [Trinickia soli]
MKRHLPSLNALRAFEAAARLGRMTAAADELAVTPGAISRQVLQLELQLGVRLFEGPKSRPELTSAAKTLLPALSAALDQIEAAVREVSDEDHGTLDVSCFSTFTVKWLIPRLYHFNALYPDIEIKLSATERPADIDRERYDLVIAVDDSTDADHVEVLPLFPEWLGPVLAPSLAARIKLRRPTDVAGKPLLHTRTRSNAWQMWSKSINTALPPQPGPEFEHYYFTLEAAIGGLGVCVAPWHLVIDDIRDGRLVAPFGFQDSGYRYVAKRLRKPNRKLDKFCAWLHLQAQEAPSPQDQIGRSRTPSRTGKRSNSEQK